MFTEPCPGCIFRYNQHIKMSCLLQVCDGDIVRAHKLVLSACSPLFRIMLKKNSHPQPMIFLRG